MNHCDEEDFPREELFEEPFLDGDYPNGKSMTDEELDRYFDSSLNLNPEEPKPPAEVSYRDVNILLIVAFILGIVVCGPILFITIIANINR